MKKTTVEFEVSSPDELKVALSTHVKDGRRFASVRVLNHHLLTRQFNFPKSSTSDLVDGLKLEASETLSVEAAEVELSYQVIETDQEGVHGIYSVMPYGLLMEYLDCFNDHYLIPVSLTSSAVSGVINFLQEQPLPGSNFCLVDFLGPGAVTIIAFVDGKPALFRELYDLSDSDLKDKITNTIRYFCSQSTVKAIGQIYFSGDLKGKDVLMKHLKELESPYPAEVGFTAMPKIELLDLNLFKKYTLGVAERGKWILGLSSLSAIFVLTSFFLAARFLEADATLQQAKSQTNIGDYDRALDLQQQLRQISYE